MDFCKFMGKNGALLIKLVETHAESEVAGRLVDQLAVLWIDEFSLREVKSNALPISKEKLLKSIVGEDDLKLAEELAATISSDSTVKFNDIYGNEDAKKLLNEAVIVPSKNPSIFTGLNSPAKGILLFGPPGNGKTLLVRFPTIFNQKYFYLGKSNRIRVKGDVFQYFSIEYCLKMDREQWALFEKFGHDRKECSAVNYLHR